MRHFVGFKISKIKGSTDCFSQSSKLCFIFVYKKIGKIWGKKFCNCMYWRKIYDDYKNVYDGKKLKCKMKLIDYFNF